MKWAILLGSATVGGGTYVIFEHAIRAKKRGEDITIITLDPVRKNDLNWHQEARILTWKTIDEVADEEFDIVINTWWRLVYESYRLKGKRYIYFVQSIESRFYEEEEKPLRQLAEATYMLPMPIITEATWIKKYLEVNYCKKPLLVHNGIRKDIYCPEGECFAPRIKGKLRVLVEGPINVDFKNVPKTINLCRQSLADEIWLMTCSEIKSYEGVDRVFSQVPIFETPKIYRSCDVIVKLSYVEGMFGPPLEMYHCGGTSITYNVTGYDEYIVHDYNGLVVKRDDDGKVIEYINRLKNDTAYLEQLKKGALQTANKWIGWEESSKKFYDTIYDLCNTTEEIGQNRIEQESKFHFNSYVIAENYYNELKVYRQRNTIKKLYFKIRNKIPESIRDKIYRTISKILPSRVRNLIWRGILFCRRKFSKK